MSSTEVRACNAQWGIQKSANKIFFEAQVEINLGIINEFDIVIQPLPQAVEFPVLFLPREPQHNLDEEEDNEEDALIEFETLDKAQIMKILRGEKLEKLEVELRDDNDDNNNNPGPRGNNPQPQRPKTTSSPGGIPIKIPDILLPPGTGQRGPEASTRSS